jgi:hypothetical protein
MAVHSRLKTSLQLRLNHLSTLALSVKRSAWKAGAKVDKWFKRNCKDVLSRECTAIEKADVLAYLIGLK